MATQRKRSRFAHAVPAHHGTRLPAQPNKSLIDGLACLQALAMREEAVGVRALARELRLEVTRTHRLLKTLAFLGIAQQDERGAYTAGPGMHVLSALSLFGSGLFRRALKPLEALHGRWSHCTVGMGVLWRLNVCYLYHAPPHFPTAEALGRVGLKPVTASSIGMVVLSGATDDHIRDLFALDPLKGTTGSELIRRLRRVRRQGYGRIEVTEFQEVSLGVRVESTPNVGIALSGPFRPPEEPKAIADLMQTAGEIR